MAKLNWDKAQMENLSQRHGSEHIRSETERDNKPFFERPYRKSPFPPKYQVVFHNRCSECQMYLKERIRDERLFRHMIEDHGLGPKVIKDRDWIAKRISKTKKLKAKLGFNL
jgi:hypothetical protein